MTGGVRLLTVLVAASTAAACGDAPRQRVAGDPERGRERAQHYQCGACHVIPGVPLASGQVGPPLVSYSRRVYLAGKLPQDPGLLARWIQDAPSLSAGTGMPAVGVTPEDARDIAAYLYRLR